MADALKGFKAWQDARKAGRRYDFDEEEVRSARDDYAAFIRSGATGLGRSRISGYTNDRLNEFLNTGGDALYRTAMEMADRQRRTGYTPMTQVSEENQRSNRTLMDVNEGAKLAREYLYYNQDRYAPEVYDAALARLGVMEGKKDAIRKAAVGEAQYWGQFPDEAGWKKATQKPAMDEVPTEAALRRLAEDVAAARAQSPTGWDPETEARFSLRNQAKGLDPRAAEAKRLVDRYAPYGGKEGHDAYWHRSAEMAQEAERLTGVVTDLAGQLRATEAELEQFTVGLQGGEPTVAPSRPENWRETPMPTAAPTPMPTPAPTAAPGAMLEPRPSAPPEEAVRRNEVLLRKQEIERQLKEAQEALAYASLTEDERIAREKAQAEFDQKGPVGKFGSWLGENAYAGLTQWNNAWASTADRILPDVLTPKAVQDVIDYYRVAGEDQSARAAETNELMGGGYWGDAGKGVEMVTGAIPEALLALLTGGTSLSATAAMRAAGPVGGLATAMQKVAQRAMKDPNYWLSFMQMFGPSYDDAKAGGASDLEATLHAFSNAYGGSLIEVGGGLQEIPGNPRTWATWASGLGGEAGEEVAQGVLDNTLQKYIYDWDRPVWSTQDENAVLNPVRAAKEAAGGALVGGVLGGGQMALGAGVDAYQSRRELGQAINREGGAAGVVALGTEFPEGSRAQRMAVENQKRIDAGKTVGDFTLGRQQLANERSLYDLAMEMAKEESERRESRAQAPVQAETETRSTERRQLANIKAAAEKMAGEVRAELQAQGLTKGQAKALGEMFRKIAMGIRLNTAEAQAILRSDGARTVFSAHVGELSPDATVKNVVETAFDARDGFHRAAQGATERTETARRALEAPGDPSTMEGVEAVEIGQPRAPAAQKNAEVQSGAVKADKAHETRESVNEAGKSAHDAWEFRDEAGEFRNETGERERSDAAYSAEADEDVTVRGVKEVRGGRVLVVVDGGETMDASALTFESEATEALYKAAGKYTTEGARALVAGFEDALAAGAEASQYLAGFRRMYQSGRLNALATPESARIAFEQVDRSGEVEALTPEAQRAAWDAGIKSRAKAEGTEATQKAKPQALADSKEAGGAERAKDAKAKSGALSPGVHRRDTRGKVSSATQGQLDLLDALGKAYGVAVIMEDAIDVPLMRDGTPVLRHANGKYVPGTREIHVAMDAIEGGLLITGVHELVHYVRDWNPEKYDALQAFVLAELSRLDPSYDVDARAGALMRQREGLDYAGAIEEIVADAIPAVLTNEAAVGRLIQKDRTLAEKVRDFLQKLIEDMKDIVAQIAEKFGQTEAQILSRDAQTLEVVAALLDDALKGAGEAAGQEGRAAVGAIFSMKEIDFTPEKGEENIRKAATMEDAIALQGNEFEKGEKNLVDQVTEFFESIGGSISNATAGDVGLTRAGIRSSLAHGIGRQKAIAFAAVPGIIEKGKLVDYQQNRKGRGHDTFVLAAPFSIKSGGYAERYFGVVAIRRYEDAQSFYLHEVAAVRTEGEPGSLIKIASAPESVATNDTGLSIVSILRMLQKIYRENQSAEHFSLKPAEPEAGQTWFSIRDARVTEGAAQMEQSARLLAREFERVTGRPGGMELSDAAVEKVARRIVKDATSAYDPKELAAELTDIMGEARHAQGAEDWNRVYEALKGVAEDVLQKSGTLDKTLWDGYEDMRAFLRQTAISLTGTMKQEVESQYGSYNEFRKGAFGRVRFSDKGLPLDALWGELSGRWPELFDADTHEAAMPEKVMAALEAIRPVVKTAETGMEAGAAADTLALTMMDAYLGATETGQVLDEVSRLRRRAAEWRERYDERMRARYAERMEKQQTALRQHLQGDERRALQARIERVALQMSKMVARPTDRKHVPEALRTPIANLMNSLRFDYGRLHAYGGKTQDVSRWQMELASMARFVGKVEAGAVEGIHWTVDPDMKARMELLLESAKDAYNVREMSIEQLRELAEILESVRHMAELGNRMHMEARHRTVDAAAEATMRELAKRKAQPELNRALAAVRTGLVADMMNAVYFGMELGGAGEAIIDNLRRGHGRMTERVAEAIAAMDAIKKRHRVDDRTIRAWNGAETEKTYRVEGGEVRMNAAQRMSLYMAWKRAQYRDHLLEGGIRVQGESKAGQRTRVNEADVRKIIGDLTDGQRAVAGEIGKVFTDRMAVWGNEVSMRMYGYRKFTEEKYFPIRVDRNEVVSRAGEDMDKGMRILSMGAAKNTVEGARNAVVLEGIFDVYASHAVDMANYSGFAEALTDAMRWYNYRGAELSEDGRVIARTGGVKESLERVMGKDGKEFFDNLIRDINGGRAAGRGSRIMNRLASNAKVAAMGANLSVAIQQGTSYLRAAAEIEAKYLARAAAEGSGVALGETRKAYRKRMLKYAPIAQWKSWGFFETNLGISMRDVIVGGESLYRKIQDKSMVLAEAADTMTWTTLWRAAELEVADKQKGLKPGTEAYYRAVAERFETIVYRTQVVDTVFTRSQAARDKGYAVLTAFMSEPITTYNVLRNAAVQYARDRSSENGRKLTRASLAVLGSMVTGAAAKALVFGLRDDDEEKDFIERWLRAFLGIEIGKDGTVDMLGSTLFDAVNPLGLHPITSAAWDVFTGGTPQRFDLDGIRGLANTYNMLVKMISGESKLTGYAIFSQAAKDLSKLTGMPAGGFLREAEGFYNEIMRALGKPLIQREKDTASVTKTYASMVRAIENGDREKYDRYKNMLLAGRVGEKAKAYDEIDEGIRGVLAGDADTPANPRIAEAAEARMRRDDTTYERIVREMKAMGFKQDVVVGAVNNYITKVKKKPTDKANLDEDMTELLYGYGDLEDAIRAGDAEWIAYVRDYMTDDARGEQKKDLSDIQGSMTNRLGDTYREYHAAGDTAARDKLGALLMDTLGYTPDRLAKWIEPEPYAKLREATGELDVAAIDREATALVGNKREPSSVKSQITGEAKGVYLAAYYAGDKTKMIAVSNALLSLKQVTYKKTDFQGWIRDDLKKKVMDALEAGDGKTAGAYRVRAIDEGVDRYALKDAVEKEMRAKYRAYAEAGNTKAMAALEEAIREAGFGSIDYVKSWAK